MTEQSDKRPAINAVTFQTPLRELAETVAQKVYREGSALIPMPPYVTEIIFVQMRQAMRTYDLLFYVNADERRDTDCYWKAPYAIVVLPLVRSMIDYLYNIMAMLEDPVVRAPEFCKSGYKKLLEAQEEDEKRYGGQPGWVAHLVKRRAMTISLITQFGFTVDEVKSQKTWPTLGRYLRSTESAPTAHQSFLKLFTYGMWREYSAKSHGAFEGGFDSGIYFISDTRPHEERDSLDKTLPRIISMHLARAAAILLCIATELQAYFKFDGARINDRIHEIWSALMPVFEVKELFDERYAQLMKDRDM